MPVNYSRLPIIQTSWEIGKGSSYREFEANNRKKGNKQMDGGGNAGIMHQGQQEIKIDILKKELSDKD